MIYLLNIGLLGIAVYMIGQWSKSFPLKKFLPYALSIKLIAGVLVTATYLYYYQEGDMLYMFHQGELLRTMLLDNPINFWKFPHTGVPLEEYYLGEYKDLNPRLVFFVKIIALINVLTFNSLWLTSLWFSVFSFLGFWYCANALASLFPQSKIAAAFSFLVCPSAIFWSSGLLKESLLCSAICISIGIFLRTKDDLFTKSNIHKKRLKLGLKLMLFLSCLYLILQIKYYYLAALLPTLLAYSCVLFLQKHKSIQPWVQIVCFFVIFFFIALLASFTHPNFHLDYFLIALEDSHQEVLMTTDADNLIYFNDFRSNFLSLVNSIPNALFASLLEPLFWEVEGHLPKLLAASENILLYGIFILTTRVVFKWQKNSLMLLACLTYIFILAILLAVSMPSIGTLVRYKAGFLPFWAYLLTYRLPELKEISLYNKIINKF